MSNESKKNRSKTTHTPGPWNLSFINPKLRTTHWLRFEITKGVAIAHVFHISSEVETEANARLIAAAPEMLELIMEIRKWYEDNWPEYIKHLEHKPTPIVFSKALGLINKVTK